MKTLQIEFHLKDIINDEPNTLRAYVAQEALDYENAEMFFLDLQQNGCISGMVSSLIYYTDTHKFFDEYYDEIQMQKENYEGLSGQPIHIKYDIKNFLAWFAFEETAYQLYLELF